MMKPTVVDEEDLLMKAESMKAKPTWHSLKEDGVEVIKNMKKLD